MRTFAAAASFRRRYGFYGSVTGGHGGTSAWLVAWDHQNVVFPIPSGGILGTPLHHHIYMSE